MYRRRHYLIEYIIHEREGIFSKDYAAFTKIPNLFEQNFNIYTGGSSFVEIFVLHLQNTV